MAGFNPHGGKKGPQFSLPNWLTGNYGQPDYYSLYGQRRGSTVGPGGLGGRSANAQGVPAAQADQSLLGRVMPSGSVVEPFVPAAKPAAVPAGIVQPAAIVSGLTPAGEVDRSQGDEYKSQMAQYRNLIDKKQQQEAEDLGMKIWMEKYGKTPMAQAGGAVGAYNPLLAKMFPDTKGYPTFVPAEDTHLRDLGGSAQGEFGPTMESLGLLNKQAAQQEATAAQADMATTAGASASERAQNLTRAFRLGLM